MVLSRWPLMNVIWVGADARSSNGTDLSCQCIKLLGKRQLDATFQQELTFANHKHQFDSGQDIFGGSKWGDLHRAGEPGAGQADRGNAGGG